MRWAWLVGLMVLGCGVEVDQTEVAPLEPEVIDDVLALCPEDSMRCNGSALERCSDDRTAFEVVEVCASAEACDPAEGMCR